MFRLHPAAEAALLSKDALRPTADPRIDLALYARRGLRLRREMLSYSGRGPVLAIGGPTAGKTASIHIPTLLSWKGPAVIATDDRGELFHYTRGWRERNVGPCRRFAPMDSRLDDEARIRINPFASVRWQNGDAHGDLAVFCDSFCRERPDAGRHYYARYASRLLFAAAARTYRTGAMPTLSSLERQISNPSSDGETFRSQLFEDCVDKAGDSGRFELEFQGALATLMGPLSATRDPVIAAAIAATDIGLDAFFLAGGSLYAASSLSDPGAEPIVRAVVDLLAHQRCYGQPRTLLLADRHYGGCGFLVIERIASYNGNRTLLPVLGVDGVRDLHRLYSRESDLANRADLLLVLEADNKTADWLSKSLTSRDEREQTLMPAVKVLSLPRDKALVRLRDFAPAIVERSGYYKDAEFSQRALLGA